MKRPGDKTPEPAGGRAAERLRMFELARGEDSKRRGKRSKRKRGAIHEEQKRRKD